MDKYKVSIVKKENKSVYDTVKMAFDLQGGLGKYIASGQKVLLKPNYTGDVSENTGAVTSLEVQESIILLLHEIGVTDITIGEGTGTIHVGTKKIYEHCGLYDLAEKYNVKVIDFNTCPMRTFKHKGFRSLPEVQMSEGLYGYDLVINIPLIKTHVQAVFTCALKNMKGAVSPKYKRYFHATDLNQSIADFQLVLPKTITLVDGLIAQEGMGPVEGTPVPLDIIMFGENSVAVDGVAMAIAGINPEMVRYVTMAADMGLGSYKLEDIEVLGNSIEEVYHELELAHADLEQFTNVEIYTENACSGCSNSIGIALKRMENAGDLEGIENLQIKAGSGAPDCTGYKNMFFVGKCAKTLADKEMQTYDKCHYVPGCAPCALDIEEGIRELYKLERKI